MTNIKKWFKCIVLTIAILFWIVSLIDLINLTKTIDNFKQTNAYGSLMFLLVIVWLLCVLILAFAILLTIFSIMKGKYKTYIDTFLYGLFLLMLITIFSQVILLITISASNNIDIGLVFYTTIFACLGDFHPCIVSILVAFMCFKENNIDKVDNCQSNTIDKNNELKYLFDNENDSSEILAQKILYKKIKEAEEKIKTKVLEEKYNELIVSLQSFEKTENNLKTKIEE